MADRVAECQDRTDSKQTGAFGNGTRPPEPHATGWTHLVPPVGLAAGLAALTVIAFRLQRGFSFVIDEWDMLAHYYNGGYLTPYNGHLSLVPIGIYQGLARTVGLGSYRPYAVVGLIIYLAIPVVLYTTHRRRIDPLLVALSALGIAWLWAAEWDVLYALQLVSNLPILMLLIAWWLIRFDDLRHDLWAVVAVGIALATSTTGVVVAFAVIAELVIARTSPRRWARFAPAIGAWLLWYAFYHDSIDPASFGSRVAYAWHLGVAILSGFTLGWKPGAAFVTIALVVVFVAAWRRWHAVDAHVVATLSSIAFFVALTAYSRAGAIALNPPDTHRYVFFGDLLLIAALLWCIRGRRPHWLVHIGVCIIVVVGAIGLVHNLRDYRTMAVDFGQRTRPYLVGAEAAGHRAEPSRILPLNLIPVTVGQYLGLVHQVGSPVAGIPFDRLGNEQARTAADQLLVHDLNVAARGVSRRPNCATGWDEVDGPVPRAGIRLDPGDTLYVRATHGGQVHVHIRRLADDFSGSPRKPVRPRTAAVITLPLDHSQLPWWASVDDDSVPIAVCRR